MGSRAGDTAFDTGTRSVGRSRRRGACRRSIRIPIQALKVFIVSGLFLLNLTRAFWAVSGPFFILSCPGSAPRSGRFFGRMGTDRVLETHLRLRICLLVLLYDARMAGTLTARPPRARSARKRFFSCQVSAVSGPVSFISWPVSGQFNSINLKP